MVHLKSCCCGCSLQTGSVLIGVWHTLSSLAVLGIGIWGSEAFKDRESARNLMIAYACIGALSLCFAIMLLIGASNKIASLLKAWVIFQIICVIISVIGIILLLFAGSTPNNFVGAGISVALSVYFILVVDSYHKDLTETNDTSQPRGPNQPSYHPSNINTV